MAKATQISGIGLLAVVAVLCSASTSRADQIIVPVQLHDYTGLSEGVIHASQAKVTSIFSATGIRIVWVDRRHPGSESPAEPLTITILPRAVALRLHPNGEAMGFTPVGPAAGLFAYVIAFRVDEQAKRYGLEQETVLAAAIAHEMGHLLLPGEAHSVAGIMRAALGLPEFRLASQGALFFLPDQARMLRARVEGT